MYGSTACLSLCYYKLQKYQELIDKNILLIDACLELTVAISLLQAHDQVKDSIFWKTSSRATKKRVSEKLNHLAFDAYSSLLKAGELLNTHRDQHPEKNSLEHLVLWREILEHISYAVLIMQQDHGSDIYFKQLHLPLIVL